MVTVNGKLVPLTHTICSVAAFTAALAVGCTLHYRKIVANAHHAFPDEWFPSVSATIGDRYPERSVFQILIALTSFPRFLLLLGHYYLNRSLFGLIIGVLRTVTCGGWVYITSTDHHHVHNVFMISYMVLTIPWNVIIILYSSDKKRATITALLFYITLVPLIYYFIEHKIHRTAGAYSIYSIFEWLLICFDVAFDSLAYYEFSRLNVTLEHHKNCKPGQHNWFFQLSDSSKEQSLRMTEVDDDDEFFATDSEAVETDDEASYSDDKSEIEYDSTITQVLVTDDDNIEIVFEKAEGVTTLSTVEDVPEHDSMLYLASSYFHAVIFWSVLTSLACSIWHFPLWYMGLSGYEATVLGYLGPIILALPIIPTVIYQYGSLVGGLISLGAYLVDKPESRLLVTLTGTIITMAYFTLNLTAISNSKFNTSFTITWILGLITSTTLKMGFYSNNPIWPIMHEENGGFNKTGLILVTIFGVLAPYANSGNFVEAVKETEAGEKKTTFFSKLFLGIGFGSLIFSIHHLLVDSSTIIYWAWEGYNQESQGPLAWPWSGLTCAVMLSAAMFSTRFTGKSFFPSLLLIGSTYFMANKNCKEWNKFVLGGLPYVASIIILIPTYMSALSNIKSIWVFGIGSLVYILSILAHVWVVAYAFVPFGTVLRERIDVVLMVSTTFIVLGALLNDDNVMVKGSSIGGKLLRRLIIFYLLITAMIGGFVYKTKPTGIPQPYHPYSKLITAGIWTVHFGLDNDMWASEDRMIELAKDMELDVFGILESDTQRIVMGNRDLTSKIAHDLNMYADFGPGPNKHTWGCALFSKFPIINSTHHLLPSPDGELAPAIHATLKTYEDELVDVFVFHSGQEEDELDRLLQSKELAKLMGSTNRPTILLSYLVVDPHEGNYNTYVSEESGMHDVDPSDDDRWCEYILYKNIMRTGYARVARGTITDTELQVAKFQVLTKEQVDVLGDGLYNNKFSDEPQSDDQKFPDMFLDEGERGHYYHVFDKPRYFFADFRN